MSSCDATPASGCAVGVGPWLAAAEKEDEENRLAAILFADDRGALVLVARPQLCRSRPPQLLANIPCSRLQPADSPLHGLGLYF
jgi:hypothetical protein